MEVREGLHASATPPRRPPPSEEMEGLRRGPWTVEEDLILIKCVTEQGEGRWNALSRGSGLKRTGKSCRLRWLNYLRPDVRRGNITPEEQLLILELHSRWGNRWSKIAQHLPCRTDNEIKNYWRTRVQKLAKQLRCDVHSKMFRDAMQYVWRPHLLERVRAASAGATLCSDPPLPYPVGQVTLCPEREGSSSTTLSKNESPHDAHPLYSTGATQDSKIKFGGEVDVDVHSESGWAESMISPMCYDGEDPWDFEQGGWASGDLLMTGDSLWSMEDNWYTKRQ